MSNETTGRVLHARLHLLDRQVVDHDGGGLLCKVDDVELDVDADVPVITAMLCGPQALGPRIGGRPGTWILAVHRRLHSDPDPRPARIGMDRVLEIDTAIRIDARGLDLEGLGEWVENHIVKRIPGATNAPE